jgi:predicted O-methyltransferase YrrM
VPTLLGLGKLGWFIPYRYAAAVRPPPRYAALEPLFEAQRPDFERWLATLERYAEPFAAITAGGGRPGAPRWNQAWFPRLDAASAYAMVRERHPAQVVEVGSGHSTRFLWQAIQDGGLPTRLVAIDPEPRAELGALPVALIRKTVQEAGLAPFAALEPGDLLLIDSSHVLMPGSDVDLILSEVLPRLPAGVVVQFHDIFLPEAYPADWEWRGYNEQQGLVGWLACGRLRPLFSSHLAARRLAGRIAAGPLGRLPLVAGARESALWVEVMG